MTHYRSQVETVAHDLYAEAVAYCEAHELPFESIRVESLERGYYRNQHAALGAFYAFNGRGWESGIVGLSPTEELGALLPLVWAYVILQEVKRTEVACRVITPLGVKSDSYPTDPSQYQQLIQRHAPSCYTKKRIQGRISLLKITGSTEHSVLICSAPHPGSAMVQLSGYDTYEVDRDGLESMPREFWLLRRIDNGPLSVLVICSGSTLEVEETTIDQGQTTTYAQMLVEVSL